MSWVYYADRKPQKEDADKYGKVIVRLSDESQVFYPWDYQFSTSCACVWLDPKLLPPLPPRKIWRTPTQADLDKAKRPLACRCKFTNDAVWHYRDLYAICVDGSFLVKRVSGADPYLGFDVVEIEVDA